MEAVADGLTGDAGAISNSLRKGVRRLEDIRDAVNDEDNLGDWKRGSVLRAIQSIVDDEEQTLHIVAPDEPARKAVRADLQLNRGSLWGRAKSRVDIHSPSTLAQAPVADELILYGPPRRGDLWILRTPHAKRLTILAYPHELGLLHYQVRSLNEAIADFTPVEVTDPDTTDKESVRRNTALDGSVPSLNSGGESDDDGEYSPTRQVGPYEGVSLDIPDPEEVAEFDTPEVEIRLEHEAHYDWVAFVPQRESDAGALTKYFGKVAGDDDFKIRGIEARQRSTPPFIEDVQRDCLERLDTTRSPDAVFDCLQDAIERLHAGTVPVKQLVERNRVSKPLEGYTQNTQNVAALKRARDQDLAIHPGQDIKYVVVDDEKSSRERVALAHEEIESYDASYYKTQLVRAVESVLAPLGWDRTEIRRELTETRVPELTTFVNTVDD